MPPPGAGRGSASVVTKGGGTPVSRVETPFHVGQDQPQGSSRYHFVMTYFVPARTFIP